MKKLLLLTILYTYLLTSYPLHVSASSPSITGFTPSGIFYQAITISETYDSLIVPYANTISLTKEITYSGIIIPDNSISWKETISGTTYSGTLYLQSFHYSNSKTIATYKGTLTAE